MLNSLKMQQLETWLQQSVSGRHLLWQEKKLFRNIVARVFGYHALQLGLPQIDYLHGTKHVLEHTFAADVFFLPFADNSIDLIVCPHIFEFIPQYHYLLQECYRILAPNGTLLISAFNHHAIFKALFSYKRQFRHSRFMNLEILTAQLQTLNFSITGGNFIGYTPPIEKYQLASRLSCLDKVGNRWLPSMANVFTLRATKQVIPHNLIGLGKSRINPAFFPQLGSSNACEINK